jgi:hypothetical protein
MAKISHKTSHYQIKNQSPILVNFFSKINLIKKIGNAFQEKKGHNYDRVFSLFILIFTFWRNFTPKKLKKIKNTGTEKGSISHTYTHFYSLTYLLTNPLTNSALSH